MVAAPKVLAMIGSSGVLDGCYLWRVLGPMAELNRQGYRGIGWDYFDNPLVEQLWTLYDAIILPRLSWEEEDVVAHSRWVNLVHSLGKAIIFEVDDDLFSDGFIDRLINIHDKSPERAEQIRAGLVRSLRYADGVTVSSEHLAALVRGMTDRPVHVVGNHIDLDWFREMKRANERWIPPLTIGWAGGIRPDTDVEQMALAWGRIAERFPDVTFVVQGHQAQVIHDNVPAERIKAIPWMSIQEYPAGIANIDIGCCPLASTPFNRCKTYIKAMEYAAMGASVVASPTVYQQLIDPGYDGYICETADEWEQALAALVQSDSHRKVTAYRLERKVERHHALAGNVWRWLRAWDEIIRDFRERTGAASVLLPQGVSYGRPAVEG